MSAYKLLVPPKPFGGSTENKAAISDLCRAYADLVGGEVRPDNNTVVFRVKGVEGELCIQVRLTLDIRAIASNLSYGLQLSQRTREFRFRFPCVGCPPMTRPELERLFYSFDEFGAWVADEFHDREQVLSAIKKFRSEFPPKCIPRRLLVAESRYAHSPV